MTLKEKIILLQQRFDHLIEALDLQQYEYTFHVIDKNVRCLGSCHYVEKQIQLNRKWVELNTVESMDDTLLHEFAHMIAGEVFDEFDGHRGKVFKEQCALLGTCHIAKKDRPDMVKPQGRIVVTCQSCGSSSNYTRYTKKVKRLEMNMGYRCRTCKGKNFKVVKNFS